MPRKPDRFERMVNKHFGIITSGNPVLADIANAIYREEAIKLLRRQHRAYVRMVEKRMKERVASEGRDIRWNQMVDSYCQACMDIGSIFKHYKR